MIDLGTKLVRLAPNWTNLGIFEKIRFYFILAILPNCKPYLFNDLYLVLFIYHEQNLWIVISSREECISSELMVLLRLFFRNMNVN